MANCPMKSHPDWRMLVNQVGEEEAYRAYMAHGNTIPTVIPRGDIKQALGVTRSVYSLQQKINIAKRVEKFNAINNTSHFVKFTQIGQSESYNAELQVSYIPVRFKAKHDDLFSKDYIKNAINTVDTQKEPLSVVGSEQEYGYFNEEGDYLPHESPKSYGPDLYSPTTVNSEADDLFAGYQDQPMTEEQVRATEFDFIGSFSEDSFNNHNFSPRFKELIKVKQRDASRVWKQILLLENRMKDTDNAVKREAMIQQRESLRESLTGIKDSITELRTIHAVEGLTKFAEEDLGVVDDVTGKRTKSGRVDRLLTKNDEGKYNLSDDDLEWLHDTISLWTKAGDFSDPKRHLFWSEMEIQGGLNENEAMTAIMSDFAKWGNIADKANALLTEAYIQRVEGLLTEKLNSETVLETEKKDIAWMAKNLLSIDHIDDAAIQLLHKINQDANIIAIEETRGKMAELDELMKKIGFVNYEMFAQTQSNSDNRQTGNLVIRHTQEYTDKISSFREMRDRKMSGLWYSRAVSKQTGKEYFQKVNAINRTYYKNLQATSIMVDVRKLFPDETLYKGTYSAQVIEAHKAELRKSLGEAGYNEAVEEARQKVEEYKQDLAEIEALYKDNPDVQNTYAINKIALWKHENSPYEEAHSFYASNQNNTEESISTHSGKFSTLIARRFNSANKETDYYDSKYEKIMSDPNMKQLYEFTMGLMKDLRLYLPTDKYNILTPNYLPTITLDALEQYHRDGMMSTAETLWNNFKQFAREKDFDPEESAYHDPSTQKKDYKVQAHFITDNSAEIKSYVERKEMEFQLSHLGTGLNVSEQDRAEWRKDITDQTAKRKSYNLPKVLKAFTMMATMYKHKSAVAVSMKSAYNFLMSTTEPVSGGQKKAVKSGGRQNTIESVENFLQNAFGYSTKSTDKEADQVKRHTGTLNTPEEKEAIAQLMVLKNQNEKAFEDKSITFADYANRRDAIDRQINSMSYNISKRGIGDMVVRYCQITNMGWNLNSAIANVGFGFISNMIEASDGRLFTIEDMRKAIRLTLSTTGARGLRSSMGMDNYAGRKIHNLAEKFDLLKESRNEFYSRAKNQTWTDDLGKASKYLKPYEMQSSGEYFNQVPIMISMLLHEQITSKDDKIVNLWEALDDKGNLLEAFKTEANEQEFGSMATGKRLRDLKSQMDEVIQFAHGNYDRLNSPIMVSNTVFGKMAVQFRIWALMGFYSRFGEEKPYRVSGIVRKGRYRSYTKGTLGSGLGAAGTVMGAAFGPLGMLVGAGIGTGLGVLGGMVAHKYSGSAEYETGMSSMQEAWLMSKMLLRKMVPFKGAFGMKSGGEAFDQAGFSEVDAANLRRNLQELVLLVGINTLGLILSYGLKLLPDDDEAKLSDTARGIAYSKSSFFLLINLMSRLQTDVMFYTDPMQMQKLNKNFLPIFSFIDDLGGLIVAIQKSWSGDDMVLSGPFKGQYRISSSAMKLIPFSKQIQRYTKSITSKWSTTQWLVDTIEAKEKKREQILRRQLKIAEEESAREQAIANE